MTFATNPLKLTYLLVRQRRWLFVLTSLIFLVIHVMPIVVGIAMKGIFDSLAGGEVLAGAGGARFGPWAYLALALTLDVARIGAFVGGIHTWVSYWLEIVLHVRHSVVKHLLTAAGSRRLPDSPSEAVTRFRDDVNDVGEYVENWVDFWGMAAYALVALAIMASIDLRMTALAMVPLALTTLLTNALRPRIRAARRASREATSRVTDFLGESFGNVQAVKVSGREAAVLERFKGLNSTRRRAALDDTVLTELFRTITDNMVNIATGVILLVGASSLQSGGFTVGDFALFVTFLPRLTGVMSFMGLMVVQHKRTGVAYERLGRLMVDAPVTSLVTPVDHDLERPQAPFAAARAAVEPLVSLRVQGLSYHHPGSSAGIDDVSFEIERGQFVVVTGRVGAGKSTLLRVLLGLLPRDAGKIFYNGREVVDPATFLVPPLAAYTSQVPRLFSDSLRENVLLGSEIADSEVDTALDLAVMLPDVSALHRGLETEVGTRGVRLSGGQVQRAAAARMFLRDAELLVFDDLSSALDVETERKLWDGLFAAREATCLVVSHRRAALERADVVIVMEAGRVQASGTLAEVSAVSAELLQALGGRNAVADEDARAPAGVPRDPAMAG